ncbi:MAG: DUF1189 family protein [Candidatus Yonathbacteria bacterium]|nr:DUF1189 family protein [Candidatus Yonathbacteria bacterium]
MKTIFETFKKSIYCPSFYRAVADAPFYDAIRFYAKFVGILALIMTAGLGVLLVPQGVAFVRDRAPELVKKYYPVELVVNIEKGQATANVSMPYMVPVADNTVLPKDSTFKNMLVIDTTSEFDKKKFEEYRTYALLTKTDLVTTSNQGHITIESLQKVPRVTIDQGLLFSWVEKIRGSLPVVTIIGLALTFMIVFFGYLMYLVPLFIFALVPFCIARLKRVTLSYSGAYKMSLYAIAPALALKTIINIFEVFFIPSYFTLLVFMLIIALNMREEEELTLFENNTISK